MSEQSAENDPVESVTDPRFHQGSYYLGHREGERCRDAEYTFAITEFTDWPDDVEVTPQSVAERLRILEEEAEEAATRPIPPGEGR